MTDMPARRRRPSAPAECQPENDAFDIWLGASLRAAFDKVAAEPIPEDLLLMIEEDRAERERLRRRRRGEG
ncbi:NepR family anti-sigma factor [Dankookia sp. P2]|uniref:NepR family anti-sigma factor n=1 Tax=Dankookia sp. P2 TaxID=3423955 RepID=UPI003D67CE06